MSENLVEREDVLASLHARNELGEAYDREVVDAFLARVERSIEARVDQRVAERLAQLPAAAPGGAKSDHSELGFAAATLGLALPLTGIMIGVIGVSHLTGIGAVAAIACEWAAIAGINIAYARRRR